MRFVFALALAAVAGTATFADAAMNFIATIDGAQSNTGSTATGTGNFVLRDDDVFEYTITFDGLLAAETVAHVHGPAAPGVNAGVVFGLPLGNPKVGSFGPLTATQKQQLLDGLWYVNIHSSLFPGGEIRGQILDAAVSNDDSSWGAVKGLYRD